MRKLLSAVGTFEWLLPAVNAQVLLQVMLELEGLVAVVALELAQLCALVMTDHVTLESVHVGEALVANLACLRANKVSLGFLKTMEVGVRVGALGRTE